MVKIVVMESPFSAKKRADWERNVRYAQACLLDCLNRGESPFASHLLYTQVLDDQCHEARITGINAGLSFLHAARMQVVYTDLGISEGMERAMEYAEGIGCPTQLRTLPNTSPFFDETPRFHVRREDNRMLRFDNAGFR